jgi:hypothetical protein
MTRFATKRSHFRSCARRTHTLRTGATAWSRSGAAASSPRASRTAEWSGLECRKRGRAPAPWATTSRSAPWSHKQRVERDAGLHLVMAKSDAVAMAARREHRRRRPRTARTDRAERSRSGRSAGRRAGGSREPRRGLRSQRRWGRNECEARRAQPTFLHPARHTRRHLEVDASSRWWRRPRRRGPDDRVPSSSRVPACRSADLALRN